MQFMKVTVKLTTLKRRRVDINATELGQATISVCDEREVVMDLPYQHEETSRTERYMT